MVLQEFQPSLYPLGFPTVISGRNRVPTRSAPLFVVLWFDRRAHRASHPFRGSARVHRASFTTVVGSGLSPAPPAPLWKARPRPQHFAKSEVGRPLRDAARCSRSVERRQRTLRLCRQRVHLGRRASARATMSRRAWSPNALTMEPRKKRCQRSAHGNRLASRNPTGSSAQSCSRGRCSLLVFDTSGAAPARRAGLDWSCERAPSSPQRGMQASL